MKKMQRCGNVTKMPAQLFLNFLCAIKCVCVSIYIYVYISKSANNFRSEEILLCIFHCE